MFSLDSITVPKDGVIVDLGANQGDFAAAAIDRFNPKRFLGIEMLPNLAEELRRDRRLHAPPYRTVLQCAVGEYIGVSKFYRVPGWEASSSLLRINPVAGKWYGRDLSQSADGEPVAVLTLDYLAWDLGLDRIDLLKIDVQGFEGRVLRGASKILQRTETVIIEVLFCQHYFGQSTQQEIESILIGDHGFNGPCWLWSCDQEGDAVFTRSL